MGGTVTAGETAAIVAAIAGLLTAAGAAAKQAIDGFRAVKSGKARDERVRNRTLLERVDIAENEADRESAYRRVISEYASRLRRLLIDMGVPEDRIPPWPSRPE